MHLSPRAAALLTTALLALPGTAFAGPDGVADSDAQQQDQIVVTGAANQPSRSATGLTLTPRETPQSITTIDQARIQDFQLTNVNDLLDQTVGINVERVESDRTYYNSRGFDITTSRSTASACRCPMASSTAISTPRCSIGWRRSGVPMR